MDEVSIHARPSKDSDRAIEALGRVAGIFKGLPCTLQEVPVLRVHDRSVSRTQAEEGCIEHGNIVKHRGPLNIVRASQLFRSHAGREQFSIGAGADGLDAIAQVSPEL